MATFLLIYHWSDRSTGSIEEDFQVYSPTVSYRDCSFSVIQSYPVGMY